MKIVIIGVAILVMVVVLIFVLGWLAPETHETVRSKKYSASPAVIFKIISDFTQYPHWRSDVKAVEIQENGQLIIEKNRRGVLPYRIKERVENVKLVTVIDDPSLPFSGTWSFDIAGEGNTCQLTITETGKVPNPLFRFFSKYVFSQENTVQNYLQDLEKALKTKS